MRVKIERVSTQDAWYKNQIGNTFTVTDYNKIYWQLDENWQDSTCMFNKSDCSIVSESCRLPEGYSLNEDITNSIKSAMAEDKGLSIEEKKSIWESFQNIRKIGRFDSNTFFNGESECAPLFHTSIDNVPVWEGETENVWYISSSGPVQVFNIHPEKYRAICLFQTASTRESCEKWIQDNRMVKESEVLSIAHSLSRSDNSGDQSYLYFEAFKEELSKLSNP